MPLRTTPSRPCAIVKLAKVFKPSVGLNVYCLKSNHSTNPPRWVLATSTEFIRCADDIVEQDRASLIILIFIGTAILGFTGYSPPH